MTEPLDFYATSKDGKQIHLRLTIPIEEVQGRDVVCFPVPTGRSGAVPYVLIYFPLEGHPLLIGGGGGGDMEAAIDRILEDMNSRFPEIAEKLGDLIDLIPDPPDPGDA